MELKAEQQTASSKDPKVQAAIDQATLELEQLTPTLNKAIENMSAGGAKRILKSLTTFLDVKLKKEEFEAHSLAEYVFKQKLTIMLAAASKVKEELNKTTNNVVEQKEKENKENV